MNDVFRIFGLWRSRGLWLGAGVLVSLAALAAGVAMMGLGGAVVGAAMVGGALAVPSALRALGVARVVLRYAERLVTHAATFRALADLRVWFFRNLARSTAGGLGFRQAGDVLARLVGDVDALDGLYLRILVPLAAIGLHVDQDTNAAADGTSEIRIDRGEGPAIWVIPAREEQVIAEQTASLLSTTDPPASGIEPARR